MSVAGDDCTARHLPVHDRRTAAYRSRGFVERSPYESTEIPSRLQDRWIFFERQALLAALSYSAPALLVARLSLIKSITEESVRVVTSPSSLFSAMSRSNLRMILPERVLGNSSTTMI
jgi:hypothetical protein